MNFENTWKNLTKKIQHNLAIIQNKSSITECTKFPTSKKPCMYVIFTLNVFFFVFSSPQSKNLQFNMNVLSAQNQSFYKIQSNVSTQFSDYIFNLF